MQRDDRSKWMWTQARAAMERVERLQRVFFELGDASDRPVWEPPADVLETAEGLFIEVALPGVTPAAVKVWVERAELVVVAERRLPAAAQSGFIRRLEIPYGRFERRIALPAGAYEMTKHEVTDGCLVLWLRRLNGTR
jgi:HSP20 family molecular chaperone IbpA